MEKNTGIYILLLGALGIGAYLLLGNQNTGGGSGGGSPGGGSPGPAAANNPFNFNFNFSGFNGSSTAAKKTATTSQSLAAQGTPGPVSQVLLGGTMINAPRAQPYGFNFLASPPLLK
jgi:hypothetical protein